LHHFGSARDVGAASLADLESVPGISKATAKRILNHFRGATT
jgi:excinuclease ABC subunit C